MVDFWLKTADYTAGGKTVAKSIKMAKKGPFWWIFDVSRGTLRENEKWPKMLPILAAFFRKLRHSFEKMAIFVPVIRKEKAIALR
jgi:hypothetical protein